MNKIIIAKGDLYMCEFKEILYKDLNLNFKTPNFKTTKDIPIFKSIIGQEQAEKFLDIGLQINKKEYNIYVSGHSSSGKTSYIIDKIKHYAKTIPAPKDWCYVFNFEDENNPHAISLPTGEGKKFKSHMEELIDYLYKEAPDYFNSNSYDKERNNIISNYEEKIMSITDTLNTTAKNMNLLIKEDSDEGFVFVPVKDGKELLNEDYTSLSEAEKDIINKNASELRLISIDTIKQTKVLEKNMEDEILKLDNSIAEKLLKEKMESLEKTYCDNPKICKYLHQVKKDIIENIENFLNDNFEDSNDAENKKLEANSKFLENMLDDAFSKRYEVNLIISNDKDLGAPVIFEDSPDYYNLFGRIEYENKIGNLITDFTHIKAGSLHKANGGFLIINAHDLLNNPDSYENLKRCLKNESISVENIKGNLEILPIVSLKAENIPLNLKVILIGSNLMYSILLDHDRDFQKLFKIKAEFDDEVENNEKNIYETIGYISNYIETNKFLHIEKNGVVELLKYGCRICESRKYLTSSIGKLLDIVDMANYFAKKEDSPFIKKEHIVKSLNENLEMHSLIRHKIIKMYKDKKYLVDTSGSKIGQINGLSVMDFGDIEMGMVHKITATTYAGRKGIVNIEREAKMSGNIHSKGVMILSGFIGELLGSNTHLSFNASIVFEQLYSGIEGDSASCAELLALLSSLSDIPLKQNIAITGSINQRGEIQPIGGVNEKIEGFFEVCSIEGLDGSQGVIIPYTNKEDLILKDEVLQAIKEGNFHIYTASTIEDCLYILCENNSKTSMEESLMDVIKSEIRMKLDKFNEILNSKNS